MPRCLAILAGSMNERPISRDDPVCKQAGRGHELRYRLLEPGVSNKPGHLGCCHCRPTGVSADQSHPALMPRKPLLIARRDPWTASRAGSYRLGDDPAPESGSVSVRLEFPSRVASWRRRLAGRQLRVHDAISSRLVTTYSPRPSKAAQRHPAGRLRCHHSAGTGRLNPRWCVLDHEACRGRPSEL